MISTKNHVNSTFSYFSVMSISTEFVDYTRSHFVNCDKDLNIRNIWYHLLLDSLVHFCMLWHKNHSGYILHGFIQNDLSKKTRYEIHSTKANCKSTSCTGINSNCIFPWNLCWRKISCWTSRQMDVFLQRSQCSEEMEQIILEATGISLENHIWNEHQDSICLLECQSLRIS